MRKVEIIIGSTRPKRIGEQVAEWVLSLVSGTRDIEFELVDLARWPLPNDEPNIPANQEYMHEHTKAWSRQVSAGDGYVFVTPQYNWGYPASLKNAIDHLYKEWLGKPAAIMSYGHRGGAKAAAQLRQVLEGLHMDPVTTMPAIAFTNEMLAENGRLLDPARDFAPYAESVKTAIEELAAKLANGKRSR
ncbi:MAG: NADPH-dependent FMN reductase [Candidatus Acidiferrales bacterium]